MDNRDLATYCLRIADDSLILGQRLGEWCGHGPILEEDIALTNVALDILGQSRVLYDYISKLDDRYKDEDEVAFTRDETQYVNLLLVEQPNGDYAETIFRQFLFDVYRFYFFTELKKSSDEVLSGLAEKAIKETAYHRAHSIEWVKRLGDGTDESHQRIQNAFNDLWTFTNELFQVTNAAEIMISKGIGVDNGMLRETYFKQLEDILNEATLTIPDTEYFQKGGKDGIHSEHMGYILSDLQYMQRTYPNMQW